MASGISIFPTPVIIFAICVWICKVTSFSVVLCVAAPSYFKADRLARQRKLQAVKEISKNNYGGWEEGIDIKIKVTSPISVLHKVKKHFCFHGKVKIVKGPIVLK
jgi:hypothetical protein